MVNWLWTPCYCMKLYFTCIFTCYTGKNSEKISWKFFSEFFFFSTSADLRKNANFYEFWRKEKFWEKISHHFPPVCIMSIMCRLCLVLWRQTTCATHQHNHRSHVETDSVRGAQNLRKGGRVKRTGTSHDIYFQKLIICEAIIKFSEKSIVTRLLFR